MYDIFGEFDSWEEINKAAAGQKAEGDEKALMDLAKENGIDKEDAEDYYDGALAELCNPFTAATGKLKIEDAELKTKDIMEDWKNYIISICDYLDPEKTEREQDQAMQMCIAVRKKGKTLKGCIAALLKWSFGHQQSVDGDILKEAGVKAGKVTLGIPGMAQAHKIIRDYYTKDGDKNET